MQNKCSFSSKSGFDCGDKDYVLIKVNNNKESMVFIKKNKIYFENPSRKSSVVIGEIDNNGIISLNFKDEDYKMDMNKMFDDLDTANDHFDYSVMLNNAKISENSLNI